MKMRSLLTIFAAVAVTACGSNNEVNHDHGSNGPESWAVTAWGQHFELFPEIDALVAGGTAGAHVHVTLLEGFTPATEGSVTVVLSGEAGSQERFTSKTTVRPGIFNVEIKPSEAGERRLSFEIEVGGVTELIPGGTVRVGLPEAPGGLVESPHAMPVGDDGAPVSFLKEQQWRTPFATEWARSGTLRASVNGTARIAPPAGGEVVLTAPVEGVVRGASWPHTGQRITDGEALLTLIASASGEHSLPEMESSVRELEALSDAAAARARRLEALLEREAVSLREVEQARAEATGLAARLDAGRADLAAAEAARRGRQGIAGLGIHAPFAGRVAEVRVSPGERVAAGAELVRVLRERPVWVRVALTPENAAQLDNGFSGLVLHTGASAAPFELPAEEIRLVAVAPEVDPSSGTVEALVEVDRSVDELKPGLRATAQILLAEEVEGIGLPDTAVVDDAGIPVVYVQLDGENFSRREVEIRHRQGDRVLVDGISAGERVVIRGGAAIRRASLLASGSVEGHVH